MSSRINLKRRWVMQLILASAFAHMSSTFASDPVSGKKIFESKNCLKCHNVDAAGKATAGPPLTDIAQKRENVWLQKIIQNPKQLADDSLFKEEKLKYPVPMPPSGLTAAQIDDVISYLQTLKEK